MSKKLFLLAAGICVFFIASAFAQDFRSEVNFQGTANFTRSSNNIDIPSQATSSGGFLAGYRYHLSPIFALEGDYGYTRNTQKYFDPVFGETDIQANTQQLTGVAVLTAPSHNKVRPYGLGGIGALFFRPTNSLNNNFFGVGTGTGNNQTKAAFVYGGGVDIDLTRYMALRAEYRGLVYKIPDFQIPGLAADAFTHTAQPSLGLVWRF
jgi:opacity protein-like surface antigen